MKRKIFGIFFLVFILAVTLITATSCDGLIGGNEPSSGKVDIEGEHEHEWGEYEVLQEPDCHNTGLEARYCQCGEEDRAVIPTIPHTYGEWITTIEPDCQSEGERYRYCIYCNNLDSERIKRTEHTMVYYPETAPTCQSEGTTERAFCSVCGENIVIGETIPKLPHTYTAEVFLPTCEEKGYTTYTCECGDSYKDNYVDALGHQEVTDAALPPTCEESGLTEGSHCARCEITLVTQRYVPPTRHSYSQWIMEVEPTCTAQGLKYRECTTCSITLDTRLIPELGHKVEYIPEKAATCEEDGLTAGEYCSVCQAVILAQAPIPPKGHSYDTVITKLSCTEGGYSTHTCKCGNEYVDGYTEPAGHTVVIDEAKNPTCTNSGLTEGCHCTECGLVFVARESIPSLGHSIKSVYTAPTCTKEGYTTYTCERCGYGYRTEYESSTPHSYVDTIVAPTCTEEGYTSHVCSYCNDSYKTAYTNATGHSFGEWVAENRKTLRYCACGEAQRVVSASAECVLINLCVGYSIPNGGIEVTATLDDNSTIRIYDFTLENELLTKEGTNEVTVKFGSFSIIVSVPAILDNLPGTNDVGEFEYTEKNGEITITKYKGISTEVVIPAHINFVPVRAIQARAFEKCTTLQSVTIPGSVHTIGVGAFNGCSGLRSVTLSEGLKVIGGQAFYGCPITSIVIPDSVTNINCYDPAEYVNTYYGAFEGCTLLETVVIGDGVSVITRETFRGCSSLKNLTIGESVTDINYYAFSDCDSLVDLVIPDSVVHIKDYAFTGCDRLKNITFGESVTTIGIEAFKNCVSIEELYIPGNVKTISRGAFYGCAGMTYLYLGEGVGTIGGEAFYGCSIASLVIPDSVTNIYTYENSAAIYVNDSYHGAFEDCALLKTVVIGNGLSSIATETFRDCDSLVDLVIGDGVVTIGLRAFYGCDRLKNISFGSSVTTIGSESFAYCISLEELYIPGNVKTIGRSAFGGCSAISDLYLEEGITTIEGGAFYGCPITYLEIPDSVTKITSTSSGSSYEGAFEQCTSLQTLIISNGLTDIPREAFRKCTALKYIEFGCGVQNIGIYAFAECSSLPSISLPDSINVVDDYAFSGCTMLGDIDLGQGIQEIGKKAFAECIALRTITIPASVQLIDDEAFSGCALLGDVIIEEGVLFWIGSDVFTSCRAVRLYYTGTESDWENISVCSNDYPLDSTPFFYSAHKPASEGNFWFINNIGEPTVWNVTEAAHKADIYYTELLEKYGSLYTSIPYLAYLDISDDPLFLATFSAYSTLEIIINPFEQITKSISKQEFYEIAIYDVLMVAQKDNPSMLSLSANVQKELFELLRVAVYNGATDAVLKRIDKTTALDEYFETGLFDGVLSGVDDAAEDISLILDAAENVFDAMDKICNYLALRNASENFQTILMDIYNDKSNPTDLRLAARNCAGYLQASFDEMLGMVTAGLYVDHFETALNFVAEKAWSVLLKTCGLETVTIAAKGIAFLMDKTLNMDATVAAFYQLTAAAKLESSLRKMVTPKVDYLRQENASDAPKYNDAIFLYECAMLKGYDYVIEFYDACQTDGVDTAEFLSQKENLDKKFSEMDADIDYRYDQYLKSFN